MALDFPKSAASSDVAPLRWEQNSLMNSIWSLVLTHDQKRLQADLYVILASHLTPRQSLQSSLSPSLSLYLLNVLFGSFQVSIELARQNCHRSLILSYPQPNQCQNILFITDTTAIVSRSELIYVSCTHSERPQSRAWALLHSLCIYSAHSTYLKVH